MADSPTNTRLTEKDKRLVRIICGMAGTMCLLDSFLSIASVVMALSLAVVAVLTYLKRNYEELLICLFALTLVLTLRGMAHYMVIIAKLARAQGKEIWSHRRED